MSNETNEGDRGSRTNSGFLPDGDVRLSQGIESQARQQVEAKYAEDWKTASLAQRWKLRREMNAEVNELVQKLSPDVSDDALF